MRRPTARACALKVLERVRRGAFATLALQGELDRARLDPRDRALATELSYGVLRLRLRLDWTLEAMSSRGLGRIDEMTRDAMRIACYELLRLRIPPHAAVGECVSTVRRLRGARLAGVANAILRRVAVEGEAPLPDAGDPELRLSVEMSAPRWLIRLAGAALPADEVPAFLESLNRPAPLWLRCNRLRVTRRELEAELTAAGARVEQSALAEEALRVDEGGAQVLRSDAFVSGRCTVQDVAAQLVGQMVAPRAGERILDACAGVGGKATHLAELSDDGAAIDAVDVSERKLELLSDHCRRLGLRCVRPVRGDATELDEAGAEPYDAILLDAPCSGLGVLRRHPEAKWRPGAEELGPFVAAQERLLESVARRLRPGGRLVYAVCSFTDEEGPGQVARFLARHPEYARSPVTEPRWSGLVDAEGALRTWPHRVGCEADAFYAARLVRRAV